MKLKNGEIFQAREPLSRLIRKELPVGISLKLAQLAQKLSEPSKVIEDVRNGLIFKHGKEEVKGSGQFRVIGYDDPKGRPVSKSFPKYAEETAELMNTEIEVGFEVVTIPSNIDGLKISANDLLLLEKFIKVE